ncbi:pyruvate formate-lyase-activating protein [Galbitalea sp. SE-J8]|uniref:pyruvate formate-lyase-activating protein n=1 Tax=Galbitalea sp. SE-J8 TaxID=3054952 RepID=UPI00259D0C98|nr:pyruvate formate-lyase-activating protein [Galbitalea sp. SE-J8]MDM4762074.1 pyruvate formate-lyase-activating protein [Galbitalea sp. SE-J8]
MPGSDRPSTAAMVASGETASVHSWELVTAVDGPGTRMTLFLSGCPLRCQYCQNPDTLLLHDGVETSADEVIARILRYRGVFDATGGGVTISGGEPLLQAAFVERVFRACREAGIRTALDTSGFLGARASDALLADTGLVLLDVKSGLPDVYREVTRRPLRPTVEFGDRLAALGVPTWVRFVLVPGLTDGVRNVEAVADIVERWPNVGRLEVLPFHQLGAGKWARLGRPYTLEGVRPPDADLVARVQQQFRARGLTVY